MEKVEKMTSLVKTALLCIDYNGENLNEIIHEMIRESEMTTPGIDLSYLEEIMKFDFHETDQTRIDLTTKRQIAADHIIRTHKILEAITYEYK